MNTKQMIVALCLLASSVSFAKAASQDQAPSTKPGKNKPAAQSQPQHEDDGARIFHQNCSRCHNTPEAFSPSISGTVVKHMRVRASLSAEDEKQLLHFLNP
jgi:cytochrome c5